jgi:hypothetical protein
VRTSCRACYPEKSLRGFDVTTVFNILLPAETVLTTDPRPTQVGATPASPECAARSRNRLRGDKPGFSEGDFQPWNISRPGRNSTGTELDECNRITPSRRTDPGSLFGFGFQDHCTALVAGYRAIQIPEIFVAQSRKAQTLGASALRGLESVTAGRAVAHRRKIQCASPRVSG